MGALETCACAGEIKVPLAMALSPSSAPAVAPPAEVPVEDAPSRAAGPASGASRDGSFNIIGIVSARGCAAAGGGPG
jgi:hypothetical protein